MAACCVLNHIETPEHVLYGIPFRNDKNIDRIADGYGRGQLDLMDGREIALGGGGPT